MRLTPREHVVTLELARATRLSRDEIIDVLRRERAHLQRLGVRHVSLFGSVARAEETSGSDIDLVIAIDSMARVSGFGLAHIGLVLEDKLKSSVDLVVEPVRRSDLKADIERDQIRVF